MREDRQRGAMGGAGLGETPLIHPTADVRNSDLGRYTEVGARASFVDSSLGDYSYIVNDCDVIYSQIGKFCSIAAHVRINPGNHPMERASQSHFTYRASQYWPGIEDDETGFFEWRKQFPVQIGHDVWIGHGAIILPGRKIGVGSVVAAGSVVTKDVPNYTIVAGNPARVVRRRFSERAEAGLIAIAWWDWSHDRLRAALPDFRGLSAEDFVSKHSN